MLQVTLDANWLESNGSEIRGKDLTGGPGWYPAIGSSTSINPYARLGHYNGDSSSLNAAKTKHVLAENGVIPGQLLDNHWMIGRFTIDLTADAPRAAASMYLRFNMSRPAGQGFCGIAGCDTSYGFDWTLSFAPRPCDGDIDLDGQCDGWDLGLLLLDFGPCPDCATDLDGNGTVDTGDMSLLLMDWNAPC